MTRTLVDFDNLPGDRAKRIATKEAFRTLPGLTAVQKDKAIEWINNARIEDVRAWYASTDADLIELVKNKDPQGISYAGESQSFIILSFILSVLVAVQHHLTFYCPSITSLAILTLALILSIILHVFSFIGASGWWNILSGVANIIEEFAMFFQSVHPFSRKSNKIAPDTETEQITLDTLGSAIDQTVGTITEISLEGFE